MSIGFIAVQGMAQECQADGTCTRRLHPVVSDGGRVSPDDDQIVPDGGSADFTLTPNVGCHLVSAVAGGVTTTSSLTSNPDGTFTLHLDWITENIDVNIRFAMDEYTLAVNVVGQGSVTKSPDKATYHYGDVVTLTPTADAGWTFSNFSIPSPVTITGNTTDTATFTLNTQTLSYTAGTGGDVKMDDSSPTALVEQTVNYDADGSPVTAIPDSCHTFQQWSDGCKDNPRTDKHVTGDITVTAEFGLRTYTLTYAVGASGGGTITGTGTNPQTVGCGGSGSEVTAVPDEGCVFVSWSNDGSQNPSRTDSNVTADQTYTATFRDITPPATSFAAKPSDPSNNQSPAFAWVGTDNQTQTPSLLFSTNLDGAGWSEWSSSTSTTLGPLAAGSHTFQVRAQDGAGNIESPGATYAWHVQIPQGDTTPPEIQILSPVDGANYPLRSIVFASWHVTDASAVTVVADSPNGYSIDTSIMGDFTFTVSATDAAGNTASKTVSYGVSGQLEFIPVFPPAAGQVWAFLAKPLSSTVDAAGTAHYLPIPYTAGDVIYVQFRLVDQAGTQITNALITLRLYQVGTGGSLVPLQTFPVPYNFDPAVLAYALAIPTGTPATSLGPGLYELHLLWNNEFVLPTSLPNLPWAKLQVQIQ